MNQAALASQARQSCTAKPERVLSVSDFTLISLDAGKFQARGTVQKHFIDVNLGFTSGTFTANSDKISEIFFPTDSIAFYTESSDVSLQTDNPLPGCLIEIEENRIREWFEAAEIELKSGPGFSGYRRDPTGAHLARAAIRHMSLVGEAEPSNYDRLTAEALALSIGARVMANMCAHDGDIDAEMNTWSRRGSKQRMKLAFDFANSNLSNPALSLVNMAEASGLSSYHLSSIIEAETGESAYAYIQTRRIAVARDMITNTNDPLEAIATKTGFSNQAHMSSVIQEMNGVTPHELREG